ncbi:NahK/ErcS family hybrid sensor histidine kinase/response regulator [Nitrospirillum sp. BR 11163]|uniref:hybrid sensor histidine kinase/response regulator n=1 Tax=Nitrospirillum sp. BR 11163 TaxID=3104323 RepID=UPI002AFFDE09|nr:NahK/ErcS family hybrid sensor histidine kinase/response regulator [Nitrospirillum sp. BR 11163]MEA1673365.1 NahK/ErcS family hybrid sensor histidine kinase/response regulator [Nitrospirillum sp. BR 11163]
MIVRKPLPANQDAAARSTPEPADADAARRVADLEQQVAKLTRINQALMDRVERHVDGQGSAFSLFQTAISLEDQVRSRTQSLEEALVDLERSYQEAAKAREQAETARLRLFTAIEAVSGGFALFDADDRLVLFNQDYLSFWPGMAGDVHPGMSFSDMVHLAVQRKSVLDAYRDPDGWVRRRLRQHAECQGPTVHALSDGRWMQINEKRTNDGGVVAIYTDITALKRRETLQWKAALAQKTTLLQATLDNIFQGVAVYDAQLALVAWNNEFVRLLDLTPRCVRRGAVFADFQRFNDGLLTHGISEPRFLDPQNNPLPLRLEQTWFNGRVLDIERNPMPDGGFVLTFTDITERKRNEEALRDSERRIRLVTDAMPALIAYADADERYQFVNAPYRQWLRRPETAILGRRMRSVLAPAFYERSRAYIRQALAGQVVSFEVELTPTADPDHLAEPRYAHVTFVPHIGLPSADQKRVILGLFTLMQDVTERRRADAAIKEANETLERRVTERTAALTSLNRQLQQEIAERREVERALQSAKVEAEQANLSKTKFLAAASHDLLQPLNSARLFVSALAELEHTRKNRSLIDNIDVSLSAVEGLLDALLDISKLDAGAVSPEIVDFPIGSLLGPLSTEHQVLAQEQGLVLRYVPSRAVVRSDIRLLRSIVQNFLSNAVRYTQRGGVLLGCRRRGDTLRIEVWDSGPGIPTDQLDEIFKEFHQLHRGPMLGGTTSGEGRTRAAGRGMGLGLAIVRRVAKVLDVTVETRSMVGRGSIFSVAVPLGTMTASAVTRRVAGDGGARPLDGTLVLVLDDEPSALMGMQALLSTWGCEAAVASTGEEALEVLGRLPRPPDALIADFHLGDGRTGPDEVSRLRQAIATSAGMAPPAIIVTADHTPEVEAQVKQHQYWMLKKPLNPAQLRALLSSMLG